MFGSVDLQSVFLTYGKGLLSWPFPGHSRHGEPQGQFGVWLSIKHTILDLVVGIFDLNSRKKKSAKALVRSCRALPWYLHL